MKRLCGVVGLAVLLTSLGSAQDRVTKVKNDRSRVERAGFWIYNDLPKGIEQARKTGRPLLVTFRCIPCEQCAQLDEQVAERDPLVQVLLGQFVCVRIVHANGMDLSLFQFDYDQSWAAFFLNADLTIYGRYGTRSHPTESVEDVSLEGFAMALAGALKLHAEYPGNKETLAGKRGPSVEVRRPEELPPLRNKYTSKIDYEGKVVQSCIHCHQIGEAQRQAHRSAGKPIPDQVLYPYPHPKSLGLILDPKEMARVKRIVPGSPAEKDGFQVGDEILAVNGQPMLSIADVQWALHHAGETDSLHVKVSRNGQRMPVTLNLEKGWRQRDSFSWRATTWELRRMVTGGLVLEDLTDGERRKTGLDEKSLALRVKHVGQYGAHAAGKQAGFHQGDIVVAADGRSERLSESNLIAYLLNGKRPGDRVPVTVRREGREIKLMLPMQ